MDFLLLAPDEDERDMQDPTQGAEACVLEECRAYDARGAVLLILSRLSKEFEREWEEDKPGVLYHAVKLFDHMSAPLPQWLQHALTNVITTGELDDLKPREGDALRMWETEAVAIAVLKKRRKKLGDPSFWREIAGEVKAKWDLDVTPRGARERYMSEDRKRWEAHLTGAIAAGLPGGYAAAMLLARWGFIRTPSLKERAPLKKLERLFQKTAPETE
jgi:hypothetical protein